MACQEIADFRDEAADLARLLHALEPADWHRLTQFKDWTVNDVVLHLFAGDQLGLLAVSDPELFAQVREQVIKRRSSGRSVIAETRERFPGLSQADLLARWREQAQQFADVLAGMEPEAKLPWFGPSMSVRSFATARQMETWAHGQDVVDVLGLERASTDRLYHVALLGVKTYGWTFRNRGLPPPGDAPSVMLGAPSGAFWSWNGDNQHAVVSGLAEHFCQVVTQVRHVEDTTLVAAGSAAQEWMQLAQCFAGPPSDPPRPGTRYKISSVKS